MAMTFNAMFNTIFDQLSKRVVETFSPKREDGKEATVNDVRAVCDRVMAESFIQITFGGKESKVLHKPEVYKACTFVLSRGDRIGDECGKKAKAGCDYCSTHSVVSEKAKIKKATCEHVFTKGKTPGDVCPATVSDGGKYCSKHKKKSTTASSESEGEEVVKKQMVVPVAKAKSAPKVVAKAKSAPKVVVKKASATKKKSEEFVKNGDSDAEDISEEESDVEFHEESNSESNGEESKGEESNGEESNGE
jgi:hypothetical protein